MSWPCRKCVVLLLYDSLSVTLLNCHKTRCALSCLLGCCRAQAGTGLSRDSSGSDFLAPESPSPSSSPSPMPRMNLHLGVLHYTPSRCAARHQSANSPLFQMVVEALGRSHYCRSLGSTAGAVQTFRVFRIPIYISCMGGSNCQTALQCNLTIT
jgi:hypothetical protein